VHCVRFLLHTVKEHGRLLHTTKESTMQHLIYCKKCNHHTTVHHLEWTAIICQSCGAEIASQKYIDLLLEKIENRDLNLAQRDRLIVELEQRYFEALVREGDRDRLIDELESHNRALTRILEKVAESIPANELSSRMYGFTTDEEGNIREVVP